MDEPTKTVSPNEYAIASLRAANQRARDKQQKPFLDAIKKAGVGSGGAELEAAQAEIKALTAERDALRTERDELKVALEAAQAEIRALAGGDTLTEAPVPADDTPPAPAKPRKSKK